jgi:hypothetical protein
VNDPQPCQRRCCNPRRPEAPLRRDLVSPLQLQREGLKTFSSACQALSHQLRVSRQADLYPEPLQGLAWGFLRHSLCQDSAAEAIHSAACVRSLDLEQRPLDLPAPLPLAVHA